MNMCSVAKLNDEQAFAAFETRAGYTTSERLRAARFLAENAKIEHQGQLSAIMANEGNPWVRQALNQALIRSKMERSAIPVSAEQDTQETHIPDQRLNEELRALAIEHNSAVFLHQLSPLVGLLELAATREIDCYASSDTKKSVGKIRSSLDAIARLRKASEAPVTIEFDLTDLVVKVAEDEATIWSAVLDGRGELSDEPSGVEEGADQIPKRKIIKFLLPRREPVVTTGDRALIELVVKNVITNAVEANMAVQDPQRNEVILNWGVTDKDSWIMVLDEGCGLPEGKDRLAQPGTSTKKGQDNLGMGLPIALQAIKNMEGSFTLAPRPVAGVSCIIRWPRSN